MSRPPPYGFYLTYRLCPACGGRLLSATPLSRTFLQGPLQRMGITCYCIACNVRYRAVSRLRFPLVAWMGPLGRWIWWQTTSLEETLTAPPAAGSG